jgi:extracellular elastinolytic metalloproteinase
MLYRGNNAHAYMDTKTARQSNAGEFVYNHKTSAEATTPDNQNAAIVNAFYIVNKLHDITYKYGFTEAGFNFQNTQVGEGGKGGDRVEISVQDNGGVNNANFATPPDGQSGQMRMYLWNITSPARDGALENDIVVHENTHGISNRMTGSYNYYHLFFTLGLILSIDLSRWRI